MSLIIIHYQLKPFRLDTQNTIYVLIKQEAMTYSILIRHIDKHIQKYDELAYINKNRCISQHVRLFLNLNSTEITNYFATQ